MSGELFIALLRGLNVGGQHRVKMADLKALFEDLDFQDVRTYVQSGNVVFRARMKSLPMVAQEIERCFEKRFGFAARVMLRSLADWMDLVESNPFPDAAHDGTKLHVVILDNTPPEATLAALAARAQALSGADAEDRYSRRGTVLYLHTPNDLGQLGAAEIVWRTLSGDATMRNWRTVLALKDLAQQTGAS